MKTALTSKDSLALKGVAILMLMFHHCFMDAARLEGYEISFFPFMAETVINVSYMFKICVSFFAFISGYGLYISAREKCKDIKSTENWMIVRIIKTMSGYWFVYVLVFIVTQLINAYPQEVYTADSMLISLTYAITDFFGMARIVGTPSLILTWWYIGAAVVYVVCVPFLMSSLDKFGTIATILMVFWLPRIIGNGYTGGTKPYAFMFTVLLGMLFARYDLFQKIEDISWIKNKFINKAIKGLVLIVLMRVGLDAYLELPMSRYWEFQYGIYAVIVLIFCKEFIIRIPGIDKMLVFFGKHSMNVFLIHSFIRYTYLRDFIYSRGHFVVIAMVLYFMSLAISVLVIEPLKKLLRYDKAIEGFLKKFS